MPIKNYGLDGIGPDVQFGKQGNRVLTTPTGFSVQDGNDVLVRVQGADPVEDDEFVTKRITNDINDTLSKLVPAKPPMFPTGAFVLSGATSGTAPLLASGTIPNNTAGGTIPVTIAGSDVSAYRGTVATVSSTVLNDNGPGDTGTITAFTNNVAGGSLTFTSATGQSINSGGLIVTDDKDYPPATPGFWQSFDSGLSAAPATVGWNRYRISHTAAGTTAELYFLRDIAVGAPVITAGTMTVTTPGTGLYSSGILHLTNDAVLTVTGATITNLSGYTYSNTTPLTIANGTGGEDQIIASNITLTYAQAGIATPIPVNTTAATPISNFTVAVNKTNSHGKDGLTLQGTTVTGTSSAIAIAGGTILHMQGTTARVNEQVISAPGGGARVDLGAGASPGDTPAVTLSGTPTPWVSSRDLSTAAYVSEAAVVGGILSRDITNYSTGFLPAGINYSTRSTFQYFDFSFAVVSKSIIAVTITGTYAGLWVALPGVSDNVAISPAALGGRWWTASVLYSGAGVPGRAGDTGAGCANGAIASGTSGTTAITFGTQSSTNATNNRIYIRIRLNAGQSISALSVV